MAKTEYFKAGRLVAASGLKGELLLKHTLGKRAPLKGLTAIFVEERKDSFIPWFIESAKAKSPDETYLKLEGIDTREAAIKLTQKEAWLTRDDFEKHSAKSAPANLLNYIVVNNDEVLGEILEVIEQPHQLLCRLSVNDKEVLVPINPSTLQKVDRKNKRVLVSLPEGLLDIYLG